MEIRAFNLDDDFMLVATWMDRHRANIIMPELLPRGWIAVEAGVPIAVSFLYIGDGKVALIEYTTTNPDFSGSRQSLRAVKALWEHLEAIAVEEGCMAAFTLVKPGSFEEHEFTRKGYQTDVNAPHLLYAKVLKKETSQCPSLR